MEGTAILLITVPIFVPIAKSFGYSITQLGIVMCIALAVGSLLLWDLTLRYGSVLQVKR